MDQARRVGEYFGKSLSEFKDRHHIVRDVRGLGLLRGIEVELDAKAIVAHCLKRGILINATSDHVLRFVPPLIITQGEIDRLIEALAQACAKREKVEAAH